MQLPLVVHPPKRTRIVVRLCTLSPVLSCLCSTVQKYSTSPCLLPLVLDVLVHTGSLYSLAIMIIVTILHHSLLDTSFNGIRHPISTQDAPVHQFRGIKYASVPARFRQSTLFASYSSVTDATKYGYVKSARICPIQF